LGAAAFGRKEYVIRRLSAMQVLKRLAEWYLGVPPAEPGQGTAWNFHTNPPWPAWLPDWGVLLLGLAVGTFVVGVYLRDAKSVSLRSRMLLIGLRLAAIVLLLLFLTELTLSVDRTGLPSIAVVIDDSASMGLEDQYSDEKTQARAHKLIAEGKYAGMTRLNLTKAVLTRKNGRFLRQLAEKQKLRVYRFSETAVPVGRPEYLRAEEIDELLPLLKALEAEGDQTRPGPAVRKILNDLRGSPPSAIVLFTDGITSTTDADKLSGVSELALSKLVPIFTAGIGSEEPARDLYLYDLLADEVAFVDDPIPFVAKLKGYGYSERMVTITLKEKGSDELLADKQVLVPKLQLGNQARPVKVELSYTPPLEGEFDYVLEATPLPGETNEDNNTQTRHVSVRQEKIRVLLADSAPRYEFRYVKHLLERDKTIELHTVLQDADLGYAQEDMTALAHFPVKREELLRYDVVILGDVNPEYLSSSVFENLRDFVRESGGGLVMVAGPLHNPLSYRGTPLEVLLPIRLSGASVPADDESVTEGFRPLLTLEGRAGSSIFRFAESEAESVEIWNHLPKLFWLLEAPFLQPGARVFAEHPIRTGKDGKLPVIVMQPYGAGKVLFHATDELWRWRFRVGDLYYGRYWIQAIRYLSRSKLLGKDRTAELSSVRSVYQRGETVQLRLWFRDERLAPLEKDGVTVMVERRGDVGRAVKLSRLPQAPTVFEGELSHTREGSYHAFVVTPSFKDVPPSTDFRVETPLRELRKRSLDRGELMQTAKATRGRYYTLTNIEELPRDIPPGQPVPLETQDPLPLWNRWEILLLFALLLLSEWLLRKRCRLI